MKRFIQPGNIVETIFLEGVDELSHEVGEALLNHLTEFCIDMQGRVRKGLGIVNTLPHHEDDPSYVPASSYGIDASPWNSHAEYLEIELPNPALEMEHYLKIREAFINEINARLQKDLRGWRHLAAA